ncbi:MAG TPA: PadR family transcriptional regulator [Alloacidobacterium sp.]|nr:PadR family transcriptional regulator [Alloacidobacterium sp.]
MARVNQSTFAVLGLLSLGPMSGYDLKQLSAWSVGHFWREGYGQIYPTLRQLEKERLVVRKTHRQKGKPDRNVYSITPEGEERLKEWLELPASPEVPRNELLLKLFFGQWTPIATTKRQVEEHRELWRQQISEYAAIRKRLHSEHSKEPGLPFWEMTLSYGEHIAKAQLAWSEETLKKLNREENE